MRRDRSNLSHSSIPSNPIPSDPLSTAPPLTQQTSSSPLISPSSPNRGVIPIIAFISRAAPDHYMVEHIDDGCFIREDVLVQDFGWAGPLAVAGFVAFNTSQMVVKCLGRNGTGDVIERFLVVDKLRCRVPSSQMGDNENGEGLGRRKRLVTGLSEREYMTRSGPGLVLPFPHSPLPFPLQFCDPSHPFAYEPLSCSDEDTVEHSYCYPLSHFFLFICSRF
jgi:hypothetical protein